MDGQRRQYDPFPADQAIAYIIEILPAFSYLHSQGLHLLRLQARQRHPGRRHDQADRPRRRAARRRRPRRAIYGTVGLPGARGRRRRAERRRATSSPSAARSRCWRWSSAATRRRTSRRCRRSTTRRCSSGTTRCTACWPRPPRPNPDDRFQSADELRDQLLGVLREVVAVDSGTAAAAHSSPSSLFGAPTGAGARARVDRAARAAGRPGRPIGDVARRRVARRRRRSACEVLEQAPEQTVEVQLAKARAAIDAGVVPARRSRCIERRSSPTTRGSGGRCGCRVSPRSRGRRRRRGDRVQHRARARCRASSRRSSRSRSPASSTGDVDLAEQLYAVCAADRRELRRAGRVRPGPDPASAATTQPGALAALDLVAPTSGAYVAARRRRAELLTAAGPGLDDLAAAAASIDGHRHRPARPAHACRRRSSRPRSPRWSATATSRRRTSARPRRPSRSCAPRPSTRTASWRRSPPIAPSASRSSTPPTRCGRGRWCEPARPRSASTSAACSTCPRCGQAVAAADQFCEACGAPLAAAVAPARREAEPAPGRRTRTPPEPADRRRRRHVLVRRRDRRRRLLHGVRPPGAAASATTSASSRRPTSRGVRQGIVHARNEDAMRSVGRRGRASVLVVCDGVTTATDSDVAVAGRRARRRATCSPAAPTTDIERARRRWSSTGRDALTDADRGRAGAPRRCRDAAVGAGREPAVVHVRRRRRRRPRPRGGVGRRQPLLLARRRRRRGAAVGRRLVGHARRSRRASPRDVAEADPRAHAITRWLGRRQPGRRRRRPHRSRSTGPGLGAGLQRRPLELLFVRRRRPLRSSVTGWPTWVPIRSRSPSRCVRLGERTGRPRQHHRRPRPPIDRLHRRQPGLDPTRST